MRVGRTRQKKVTHQARKTLFLLVLVASLTAVGWRLKVSLSQSKSVLSTLSRLNFLFVDSRQQPLIFSFEGEGGLILVLPATAKMKVTRGFGEYELGKVYALGELEKKGGFLLKETVQENFSVPLFGYFYDSQAGKETYLYRPKAFFPHIFWQAFWGKMKTDISKYDLALLFWRSKRLNEFSIKAEDFFGEGDFKDKRLREESLSLEVLNGTDYTGLAQQVAKLLEKAGGRVVRTADSLEKQEDCLIRIKKESETSYTLKWLKEIFPCRVQKAEGNISRADLTLVLGQENWKKWSERW